MKRLKSRRRLGVRIVDSDDVMHGGMNEPFTGGVVIFVKRI
ncbi:MAG: hypothetical protein AAB787_01880 [Patescibacteria group bacterium]